MATLNGRKVKMVRMHAATHVEGIGNLEAAIQKTSGKAAGELELTLAEGGVYVNAPHSPSKLAFFIPFGNIQLITLEPESNVVPLKK